MQPETLSVSDGILAMEEARFEENKRVNSEREILLALVPDKSEELKRAFKEECSAISEKSHLKQFECEEPGPTIFYVNRVIDGNAVVALAFTLDLAVPRILIEDHWNEREKSALGFAVSGSNVLFANRRSGVVLPELVVRLMMQITR